MSVEPITEQNNPEEHSAPLCAKCGHVDWVHRTRPGIRCVARMAGSRLDDFCDCDGYEPTMEQSDLDSLDRQTCAACNALGQECRCDAPPLSEAGLARLHEAVTQTGLAAAPYPVAHAIQALAEELVEDSYVDGAFGEPGPDWMALAVNELAAVLQDAWEDWLAGKVAS